MATAAPEKEQAGVAKDAKDAKAVKDAALPAAGDAPEEDAGPALGGAEKTALLLLLLEEREAALLLSRLDADQVERVGRAMLSVAEASPAMIDAVLSEVLDLSHDIVAVSDGPETVRGLLDKALGDTRAAGMRDRIGNGLNPPQFERLGWLEPFAIASLIESEHPQVQAVILTQMPEKTAARVLSRLPADSQPDLIRRIATLGPVAPATIDILDETLTERISVVRPRQLLTDLGGVKRAADLINLSGIDEEMALRTLSDINPQAGRILEETLFTFADLASLDAKSLQELVQALDAELLVPALRAADAALKARIFAAMPQRAAQSLEDEISNRGPVKIEDAEMAQKTIAATARRLSAEGVISLPGKGPAYV